MVERATFGTGQSGVQIYDLDEITYFSLSCLICRNGTNDTTGGDELCENVYLFKIFTTSSYERSILPPR